VTRREWKDTFADKIKPGDVLQAYDKVAFLGGKKIGEIEVEGITKEPISEMPVWDYQHEGFEWLYNKGIHDAKGFPYKFDFSGFCDWRNSGKTYWVLRFKKLDWIEDTKPKIQQMHDLLIRIQGCLQMGEIVPEPEKAKEWRETAMKVLKEAIKLSKGVSPLN
jgi:hypothetical protein